MQFTPLRDFFSEELKSEYCVGLSYRARPEDKKLLSLLPTWIAERKVRQGLPDGPVGGSISGTGEAQTIDPGDVGTLKL